MRKGSLYNYVSAARPFSERPGELFPRWIPALLQGKREHRAAARGIAGG